MTTAQHQAQAQRNPRTLTAAAGSIFSVVTATADAIEQTVENTARVVDVYGYWTKEWAMNARRSYNARKIDNLEQIRHEAALRHQERSDQIAKLAKKNPEGHAQYVAYKTFLEGIDLDATD